MRAKVIDLLTPSQESVYNFVGKSTRWLTAYEISMLTGVSLVLAKAAMNDLKRMGMVETRTCIRGFENGEPEFKSKAKANTASRRERLSDYRLFGVEPLSRKLQRFLGVKRAREAEQFLK